MGGPTRGLFANLLRNSLRQSDCRGIGLQFLQVDDVLLGQIHLQAHEGGSLRRRLRCLWEAPERNTLTLANGVLTNAGFKTITLASQVALFEEQPAGGISRR